MNTCTHLRVYVCAHAHTHTPHLSPSLDDSTSKQIMILPLSKFFSTVCHLDHLINFLTGIHTLSSASTTYTPVEKNDLPKLESGS